MATKKKTTATEDVAGEVLENVVESVETVEEVTAKAGEAVETALDNASNQFEKAVAWGREQVTEVTAKVEENAKKAVADVKENFTKAQDWSKSRFATIKATATDVAEFGKASATDLSASGKAAAEGLKAVGEAVVEAVKLATEENVETAKKLWAVKSFGEAVELQDKYTKTALDLYLAHTQKIAETTASAIRATIEPLHSRFAALASEIEKRRTAA